MHLNLFIIIKLNFSGHLQVVEEITLRDFNSARNGLQIRRPQPARQRNRDARIAAETHNLNVGRITLIEFLEIASNFFEPADLHTEVHTSFCFLFLTFFSLSHFRVMEWYVSSLSGGLEGDGQGQPIQKLMDGMRMNIQIDDEE